jgi:hypothetical protein
MSLEAEVKVRDALRDIKSGLSDLALMEKYRLSDKGLGSLFRKFVSAGLLQHTQLESRDPTFTSTIPSQAQQTRKPATNWSWVRSVESLVRARGGIACRRGE